MEQPSVGAFRRDRRTLSSTVISAYIGKSVAVELKNDIILHGTLDQVDKDMNLTLGLCSGSFCEGVLRGKQIPSSELVFVQGRKIRYINLLEEVGVFEQIRLAITWRQQGLKRRRHYIVAKKRSKRQVSAGE